VQISLWTARAFTSERFRRHLGPLDDAVDEHVRAGADAEGLAAAKPAPGVLVGRRHPHLAPQQVQTSSRSRTEGK
jgi:hypothetical protein